jgi:NitT/TauT family transport system substrate-binding protein
MEVHPPVHPSYPVVRAIALAAVLAVAAAACSTGSAASPSASSSVATPVPSNAILVPTPSASITPSASPAALTPLTVGLGYIPSVQFAQFYLADQAGYYRDAGLTVDLQNGRDADLVTLLGQGTFDIGNSDGTSVIPAVSQGIPIVYAATIYGQFPSIVLAKADSGIKTAADLKGKKIGTPGKYGSSWIMLQALLGSANLTTDDVTIVEYPDYGQATALQQGAVDAATGFANNEPIQLRKAGIEPVVLTVDDIVPLPGPGLVTGTATLTAKHDALAAFTAATIKAMNDIAADPQKGLDATFKAAPDLAADPDLQKQILDATIATWKNTRTNAPYGTIDADGWKASLDFMTKLGLVPNPVTVDQLVTNDLLP